MWRAHDVIVRYVPGGKTEGQKDRGRESRERERERERREIK